MRSTGHNIQVNTACKFTVRCAPHLNVHAMEWVSRPSLSGSLVSEVCCIALPPCASDVIVASLSNETVTDFGARLPREFNVTRRELQYTVRRNCNAIRQ